MLLYKTVKHLADDVIGILVPKSCSSHFRKRNAIPWTLVEFCRRDCVQSRCHLLFAMNVAGSEYKVDASYLSPNVDIASRLEAATKQFGVTLLMSQVFTKTSGFHLLIELVRTIYSL